jgi:hypothetical protein
VTGTETGASCLQCEWTGDTYAQADRHTTGTGHPTRTLTEVTCLHRAALYEGMDHETRRAHWSCPDCGWETP